MRELLSDKRVLFLVGLVLLSLAIIFVKGINYGIEFEGGVRIPITFDRELTPSQMDEVVSILKTRISKFGLSQVIVRPLPPREVQVELAKGDESSIKQIEKILQTQGSFESVINNKVAMTGEDILPGSIGEGRITTVSKTAYRWEVDFAVTEAGANRFAAVALGQANKPVYMFLDRPHHALVLLEPRHFPRALDIATVLGSITEFNSIEGSSLKVVIVDDWAVKRGIVESEIASNPNRTVIYSSNASFAADVSAIAQQAGATTRALPDTDMAIEVVPSQATGDYIVNKWKAIGLLSAPILSEGLAKGTPSRLVSISGTSENPEVAHSNAKEIRSILSGGRLPVNAIIGSTISIPAPLGKQFLEMSVVGGVIAFILIIIFVSLRYGEPRLFMPIIVISFAEIVILVAIIGGFGTIDFAAMAGIIAAMGVSLDAQIIITDEIFRKGEKGISKEELKERIKGAFYIITRNVAIAIIAMLPLFFSGVVEIVGFATSTILGALLGLLISRPAYAALIESLGQNA
ncbi:MAG: hypothetical protein N3H30_03135 [Candidatus Micrarchaeota archaeon]|nr:hypothetical protein [Candidatus Micrarchaeota archaeon]